MRHSTAARGVTPFAAVAGIAAVAVISSALWLFERTSSANERVDSTRESATIILRAAQSYKNEGGDGCPTISKLREEQQLLANARSDDAWGNRFRIQCAAGELSVSSPGADGKVGTADDVRVPR